MRIKRYCSSVGIVAASMLALLPGARLWAEIAGIPEVHETAVLGNAPMGTNGVEILVGEPDGEYTGVASGIVHVLSRSNGSSWIEVGEIGPAEPVAGMSFGDDIAFTGSQALISASASPSPGLTFLLFNRTATGTWIRSAEFVGDVNHVLLGRPEPEVTDNTVVLGSRSLLPYGRVGISVFERDGDVWPLQQRVTSPESDDGFGVSVALSSDTLVVGASTAVVAGVDSGAAYVYVKPATGIWEFAQKLVATPTGMEEAYYGLDVAVAEDLIVVGSPCDWALGPEESCAGAAYIYRRTSDDKWVEEAKLLPPFDGPDPPYGAQFGNAVAIENGLVYICENQGRWATGESGSCWAFRNSGEGDWQPLARLIPEDPFANLEFGEWIDLEGRTFLSLAYAAEGDSEARIYVFDTAALSLEVEVAIDIKPFDNRNQLDPSSPMLFSVGILSDDDFDALQTDLETIRLEPGEARARNYRVYDANRDRIPDLVPLFRARDLRIGCGETEVELTGKTHAGVEFLRDRRRKEPPLPEVRTVIRYL